MADFKVIVHAQETIAAFEDVKVKVDPVTAKALSEAGKRVRDAARDLAVANVTNIGPVWSRFKSGRRGTMVYVAGSAKASGGSSRPNLSPLLFNVALLPAARAHEEETKEVVERAIDILCLKASSV